MKKQNKKQQVEKEYRFISKLKKQGYDIIVRTKDKNSLFDIIAINGKYIRFIKIKDNISNSIFNGVLSKELEKLDGNYIIETSII